MAQPKSVEAMEHEIESQSTLLLKLELPERVDPTKCVMTGLETRMSLHLLQAIYQTAEPFVAFHQS
jgi:hypothetical protein